MSIKNRKKTICSMGFTLVELIISMLIISIIGSVGVRSFIQVLKVNDELRECSEAYENARMVTDELSHTISNIIPYKIGGVDIYSEGIELDGNEKTYSFLTRIPEKYMMNQIPEDAQSLLVKYKISRNEKDLLSLSCSKSFVTITGIGEDIIEGTIVSNLSDIQFTPMFDNVGENNVVPVSFTIKQEYRIEKNRKYSTEIQLPVYSKPREEGT